MLVPTTLFNSLRQWIAPLFELDQASSGTDVIAKGVALVSNNFTFAFGTRPSIGGRLYYQPGATWQDDPVLLAAGARWAATGS